MAYFEFVLTAKKKNFKENIKNIYSNLSIPKRIELSLSVLALNYFPQNSNAKNCFLFFILFELFFAL